MTVAALPPRGQWFGDPRDDARALRVSWHAAPDGTGCVVLSTWREDSCVATTRLSPVDAARLISVLAGGLAAVASDSSATGPGAAPRDVGSA